MIRSKFPHIMPVQQINPNVNTGYFSEDIRKFLLEKWSIATQFPNNKNLTQQILANRTLQRYLNSNYKKNLEDRQIEDFLNILKLLEKIQECKNLTIYSDYKSYLDYVFENIINSSKNNYNSLYSIDTEEELENVIKIKKRNRLIRKIFTFGLV